MSKTKGLESNGSSKSKPLPKLPLRKSHATLATTRSSYASTPSGFYISEPESWLGSTTHSLRATTNGDARPNDNSARGGRVKSSGGGGGLKDTVEIYSPQSDTTRTHLIAKNTITYHSNFFAVDDNDDEMNGFGRADPLEVLGSGGGGSGGGGGGSAVTGGGDLSPVDLRSPAGPDYFHHQSHRNRSQTYSGSRTRTQPVELEYYDVEGAWAWDASGRAYYRGTGKIEEVDEEEDEEEEGRMDEEPLSPRKSSLMDDEEEDRLVAALNHQEKLELTDPLPPHISPPPRPKRVEQVVLTPGTAFSIPKTTVESPGFSDIGVPRSFFPRSRPPITGLGVQVEPEAADVPMAAIDAPPPSPPPKQPIIPGPEEPDLETQMLIEMIEWANTGVGDINFLRDFFFRILTVYFVRRHIDVTYRVETALLDVRSAIDKRRSIPQSHLDIRTAEWQEKFELRLMSFRTTVQRLTSIRRFVEARKNLTERHLEILLHKLLAHEMKYSDIAIKLNASFDRLKLRHLHTQLENAYKAEVEARKERHARKRKASQRRKGRNEH